VKDSLEWRVLYRKALAETDPLQMPIVVSRALRAIAARLASVGPDFILPEEMEALTDALATLSTLQEKRRLDERAGDEA
jgi:hypothetical protein